MTVPLEGPNVAWTCQALEDAFRRLGPPRHLITDREGIFTGAAFRALLDDWGVKLRHGAVGRHGSIAVTERVIRTFKYEWLARVPLLRGFRHLTRLCEDFVEWYNAWRPHTRHDGFTPDQAFRRDLPEHVPKTAKSAPLDAQVERRVFPETGITGFRLRDAA